MHIENGKDFCKAFYQTVDWVENLFADYERRMEKEGKKEGALVDDNALVHWGGGGEPPESPYSSSISSTSINFHHSNSHQKNDSKKPFLKLDRSKSTAIYNRSKGTKQRLIWYLSDWEE